MSSMCFPLPSNPLQASSCTSFTRELRWASSFFPTGLFLQKINFQSSLFAFCWACIPRLLLQEIACFRLSLISQKPALKGPACPETGSKDKLGNQRLHIQAPKGEGQIFILKNQLKASTICGCLIIFLGYFCEVFSFDSFCSKPLIWSLLVLLIYAVTDGINRL